MSNVNGASATAQVQYDVGEATGGEQQHWPSELAEAPNTKKTNSLFPADPKPHRISIEMSKVNGASATSGAGDDPERANPTTVNDEKATAKVQYTADTSDVNKDLSAKDQAQDFSPRTRTRTNITG